MKKKTIANGVMVAIIAVIAAAGILIAGNILGWFDKADTGALLTDIRGIVHIHRDGVSYTAEKDTVLRAGDTLTCEKGATAKICVQEGYLTIGETASLTVTEPSAEAFSAEMTAGELFASCSVPATVTFSGKSVQIADAAAHISVRTGTQTVSVFSGSVGRANAGQLLEYINGEEAVRSLQIDALNDFTVAQLRAANKSQSMYFTDEQLDELTAKRNAALQDKIDTNTSENEQTHQHAYTASVVPPTCTEEGCTEYVCACGHRYTDTKTEAKGHTWTEWITEKVPTTSAEGVDKRTCTDCDASEERTIAKLPEGHVHSYTEKTVLSTCTAGGYTLHTCSCGVSYKDKETSARGHSYTAKVTEPTCTTGGYTLHTCSCGHSYTDGAVSAKGHSWNDWETAKQPTVLESGLKKRTCKICTASEEEVLPLLEQGDTGYVYITIRCNTILNNMDELNPAKAEFVPADGVILPKLKVAYTQGESVFDILVRVCQTYDIQLEYNWQPMFDTYYIQGIHNLYEKDCGSESGWMFQVNGWFPNYGVSAYTVSDGDVIEFLYSCHGYGTDVGAPEWME